MNLDENARILVGFAQFPKDFELADVMDGNYDHMGAKITNAIIQAEINDETVAKLSLRNLIHQWSEDLPWSAV